MCFFCASLFYALFITCSIGNTAHICSSLCSKDIKLVKVSKRSLVWSKTSGTPCISSAVHINFVIVQILNKKNWETFKSCYGMKTKWIS